MDVLRALLISILYPFFVASMARENGYTCPTRCLCDAATKTTRCKALELQNLTEVMIHPSTVSLDLSYNKFRGIPEEIRQLSDLIFLYLHHNHIGSITAQDFLNLNNVTILDLSYNNLRGKDSLDVASFLPLENLHTLNLSHNHFPDSININSGLQILQLINCSIINIADITRGLKNISSLNLSKNPIKSLERLYSNSLTNLNVSDCDLEHINPTDLVGLIALTDISISRNRNLKSFRANSEKITHINLSHCNLNEVWFSSLSNLIKLNLQGNRIFELQSNAFQNNPKLDDLILSNNAITSIEKDAFAGLTQLQILDMSFNRITELKFETFNETPKLRHLRLSRNYLRNIKLKAQALRELDVSHCEIKELTSRELIDMPNLETLDVSNNWLPELPNRLEAQKLKKFDASMCGIWTLNNSTFAKMPKLKTLNLQGNRLSYEIGPDVFHNIKAVYLGDNPWGCNCHDIGFQRLYEWLTEDERITDYFSLLCRSPEKYEGKHWYDACRYYWETEISGGIYWVYTLLGALVFGLFVWLLCFISKMWTAKKQQQQEIIQQTERQEARNRLHQMRREAIENQEEVDRNAPDPRDVVAPPTYDEAVLLPRVSGSISSISCMVHSPPTTESINSTSATESTATTSIAFARELRNKRRRRRRRSAFLYNSTDGASSSKTSQGPDSQVEISEYPSPNTTEKEDNDSGNSANVAHSSTPEETLESLV